MSQHHFPRETATRDAVLDMPREWLVDHVVAQGAILKEMREYIDYLEYEHPYHSPPRVIGIIKRLKKITKYEGGVY